LSKFKTAAPASTGSAQVAGGVMSRSRHCTLYGTLPLAQCHVWITIAEEIKKKRHARETKPPSERSKFTLYEAEND
jgi:hypothetical protein